LLKTISLFGIAALVFSSFTPAKAITKQCTVASYYGYGDGFHGRTTANGERFNGYGTTTAHPHLPFGSLLLVLNPNTGKSVTVRVNDRGPYAAGRGLDLSYGAFVKVANPSQGIAKVCYSRIA
jgi:rare lipoprotein A